ncbi:hypothetical protein G7Y89_g12187 [Cudoniella acicularis]|uniref:DUF676 domain-containing protein n=1 Tax=Cudoniella acicularis TaxID=354080 RepID=A0A8H4VXL2_9HELO|nr:hypothetical protein G7Y89_g12187 [Cudoniella acicularis]
MAKDIEQQIYGLRELYRPKSGPIQADIVAVHGLNGGALSTWTASNGKCWLGDPDFLPKYVPQSRVMTWGYNATVVGKTTSSERVMHHAHTLVASLCADREFERATDRPIIFVCHSLGGNLVKRALAYAESRTVTRNMRYGSINTCTYGILFFGTPHLGSSKAKLAHSLQRMVSLVPNGMIESSSSLLKSLEEESETLQNINDHFAPLMPKYQISFYWETEKTRLGGLTSDYIVEQDSAAPLMIANTERCGIEGDHRQMVKFEKNTDQGFKIAAGALMRYTEEAQMVVGARYARSEDLDFERRKFDALEILSNTRYHTINCMETNESCNSTEDHQLPTRLVDLGTTPIRLVQSSDLTTKSRYATLSHCWGSKHFHTLQEDNLEEFMSAIPEEKLTKTFQDAIYITCSLGLRESALMRSIYGGSTITIAAAGAIDGTKGCSQLHRQTGRAWALQERLLSPRTLHFSKTELFWECRTCDAFESFLEGSPEFEHQHMFHRDRKPISEIWHTIKAFEETGDQYLAGLWRKDIELQLFWCQQSPGTVLPAGKEPFGELVGDELRMSCSVMLAGVLKRIYGEEWDGMDFSYHEVEIDSSDNDKEKFRVYPDSDDLDGRTIYLLLVLENLGTDKYNKRNISGLVVLPTDSKKGEYSRAGFFDMSAFDEGHRKTQDRFLGLLELSGKAIAEARCIEVLEDPVGFGEDGGF